MALTQVSTGGIKDGQISTADLADAQITAGKLHADALDHTYTLGASGTDHYTFTGEGLTGTVNDPTLYLTRGAKYRFVNGNSSGAHPFRIQSVAGAGGTEYNTGVTNNAGAGGSTIIFEVPHDAPDVLYYICTSHASMNGIFYVTGALADGTVTTAKLADDAITDAKLANSINTAIAANTAKDLTALSASNLTSGTVPDARFPATLPAASAANLTAVPAANITGTLPAISAANLTNVPAANITGTLPAINGANLTSISAANITGTLPAISGANLTGILPSQSGESGKFLKTDGSSLSFAEAGGGTIGAYVTDSTFTSYTITSSNTFQNGVHSVTITPTKAGSKMLILIGSHGKTSANPNNGCYFITRINRNVAGGGSTNIHNCLDSRLTYTNGYSGNRIEAYGPLHPSHHVDTPSYTLGQSIVYTFDIGASMNVGSSTHIIWNDSYYNQSHFTVMELTT